MSFPAKFRYLETENKSSSDDELDEVTDVFHSPAPGVSPLLNYNQHTVSTLFYAYICRYSKGGLFIIAYVICIQINS